MEHFSPCILHLDMDAFFASVEQVDNPALAGLPVIVGGGDRGVVSACSYEARRFGVRSAMPMVQARRLCPGAAVLAGRMERYVEVSETIMRILEQSAPLVEQASVDEAYLDVSGMGLLGRDPLHIARDLKQAILSATSLRCSVGIAPLKFLAKIASDYDKPDGLCCIPPAQVQDFLTTLPVERIPGVGKKSLPVLHRLNVRTAGDIARFSREFWLSRLGKWGGVLHDRASGIDPRPVAPVEPPKSESAETTFSADTADRNELANRLLMQAERVGRRLRRQRLKGRTITLKLRYSDFTTLTRSRTLARPTACTRTIFETALSLLEAIRLAGPVRLIGLGVGNFLHGPLQQLLPTQVQNERDERLDYALDRICDKYGRAACLRGRVFDCAGK